MKKNLFVINENERNRILNMHENATKNNYVFEQETTPATPAPTTPPTPRGTCFDAAMAAR